MNVSIDIKSSAEYNDCDAKRKRYCEVQRIGNSTLFIFHTAFSFLEIFILVLTATSFSFKIRHEDNENTGIGAKHPNE